MSFWVVAMFWWGLPVLPGSTGTPSHRDAPRKFSEFHITGWPVHFYDSESACMRDIPKRRADMSLPDALTGGGLMGYTCIRLTMNEVSHQPPIPPVPP